MFDGFPGFNRLDKAEDINWYPWEQEEPEWEERFAGDFFYFVVFKLNDHYGKEEADNDTADTKENGKSEGIRPNLCINE